MSEQWLRENISEFADLPSKDRKAIFSFVFLWSLFEARVVNKSASARQISEKVDEWHAAGFSEPNLYDDQIGYFRKRYFAGTNLTHHFDNLHLRRQDMPSLVADVIKGVRDGPRDRVVAVLLIVWRFRNNLFHGEKWDYHLRDQLNNFTHANAVLMRVLERHGRERP